MITFRALLIPMAIGAAFLIGAEAAPAAAETSALAEPDAIVLIDGRYRGRHYGPTRRHWRGPPPRYYAPPPPRRYRPPPVYFAPPPAYYAPRPRYYRPPPRYHAPKPGVGLYFRF